MTNKDMEVLKKYHNDFLWNKAREFWYQREEPENTDEIEILMGLNLKSSWMNYADIFIRQHFKMLINFISAETGTKLEVPPEVLEVLNEK